MMDTGLLKVLLGLTHSPRTCIVAGSINNQDFIVLAMHLMGPFGANELRHLSQVWRGSDCLETYFGPHSGYTGRTIGGTKLFTGDYGPAGGAPKHAPWWFRLANGVPGKSRFVNALTTYGQTRANELIPQLQALL
jgi:hypothetical protein